MTLSIDLSPQTSARLSAVAQRDGVDLQTLVSNLVERYLLPIEPTQPERPTTHSVDPANEASIALLESWLAEDATEDPKEIRKAHEELDEFKRNMNRPRKEAGARLLFPEV